MPVMEIHLVEDQHGEEPCKRLLQRCAALYAQVLNSPMDRVRVFITLHRPALFFASGALACEGSPPAPYFSFIVLQGRSLEERQRLLSGFTDLIVEVLGVERGRVRGACRPVPPEDWGIGGTPASELRALEVRAREQTAALR